MISQQHTKATVILAPILSPVSHNFHALVNVAGYAATVNVIEEHFLNDGIHHLCDGVSHVINFS